jgi:metallo-beta-lactamase family protein
MLPDSGHIQEMETEWDNRKRKRAGKPLREPLYTLHEAEDSLRYFKPVLYNQQISLNDSITVRFQDAGHILGSAIIEIWINEQGRMIKLVFSGDLGRKNKPILRDPAVINEADYVVTESTYGDHIHHSLKDEAKKLISIINETQKRQGNVIIPSFAIQRAQDIIYELNRYYEEYVKISNTDYLDIPVYIDSPLTASATEIFNKNPDCFDEQALSLIHRGDNPLDFNNLNFTRTVEESKSLNTSRESKVIISASGMCTAGRIKHHLKHNLWRKESSIVFVGYQAEGTLGRRIKEGAKKVRIFGEEIKVNAQIHVLEGFSSHADQQDIIQWLKSFTKKPKQIFLVHGEENAIESMSQLINQELHVPTYIPGLGEAFEIKARGGVDTAGITKYGKKVDIQNLEKEYEHLRILLDTVLNQLESHIKEDLERESLNKIRNKLIELRKSGIELSMILTDKNKERNK